MVPDSEPTGPPRAIPERAGNIAQQRNAVNIVLGLFLNYFKKPSEDTLL
jgi:hypothetical protein